MYYHFWPSGKVRVTEVSNKTSVRTSFGVYIGMVSKRTENIKIKPVAPCTSETENVRVSLVT